MARKLDRGSGLSHSAEAARLQIVDWDEGASQPVGWSGVNITYRQEKSAFAWEERRSFLRVHIDPEDPMLK
jgi:hypothetical protein